MRATRLVIAALVGLALAVAPVAAGFAQSPMSMGPDMHLDMHLGPGADMGADRGADRGVVDSGHAGMSTTEHDTADRCCDALPNAATVCSLKCCSVLAILVDRQPLSGHGPTAEPDAIAAVLSPFTRQPDPPPPRA